jgi:hypothetical protein
MSHAAAADESPATTRRLAPLLLSSLALYALLAAWFPLQRWLPRGRITIGSATERETSAAIALLLIGAALYGLYVAGAIVLWRRPASRGVSRLIWLGAIAAGGTLLAAYPVTSSDVFDYVFRARMAVTHAANPYLVVPNRFSSDPWYGYIGWPNAPSAYGPLWERLAAALAVLGGDSLHLNVLLFKLIAAVSHLATGVLIGRLADPSRRALSQYLWLWCPLGLWELAATGHNDGLMIALLLVALLAARRDRHGLAVLSLTLGALIKFLPALLLPLVVLDWMRRRDSWRLRIRVAGASLALAAVITIVLYAPFWDVPPGFADLAPADQIRAIWQGRLTTLRNISVRENFLHAAPLATINYALQRAGLDSADVRSRMSLISSGLVLAGVAWQSWHVWARRRPLETAFVGLLLWYIVGGQWFQPWYLLWLLSTLAIRPQGTRLAALWAWMIAAQASYLLQFFVLPQLGISGQTLTAQVAYLLLIYLPPLIVWLVARRAGGSRLTDAVSHASASARKSSTT